jgi:hypothetical protein
MRHLTTILLLFFTLISAAQNEDLFPDVAWRTNVADVTVVNDSTYQFKVMPQDINEPEVVDSAYLSVTVEDVFDYGVSPQRDRIGVMYNSAYYGLSPYLSTISFRYLHSLAIDNVRKIENAVLWKNKITSIYDYSIIDLMFINQDEQIEGHIYQVDDRFFKYNGDTTETIDDYTEIGTIITGNTFGLANLYYTTIASETDPTYYKLSYEFEETETELPTTVQASTSPLLIGSYVFDDTLKVGEIPAGTWTSIFYAKTSNSQGISYYQGEFFLRHSDGSETTLFSMKIDDINATDYTRYQAESVQNAFQTLSSDKLGVRVYAVTNRVAPVTITTIIGDVRGAYLNVPLQLRHDLLRDKNGNEDFQHITLDEKIKLQDSVLMPYDFATVQEALIGNDSTKIMSPLTNRDSDTLLYVPFYGAAENVHSDHNATFDTLKSQAMQGVDVRAVAVMPDGSLIDTSLMTETNYDTLSYYIPLYELATILEAQTGVSDKIMTALRTAEQLTLNAVSYYNVREDIHSNFDARLDSIFASNHYEFATLEPEKKESGIYRKDFETDFIDVFLNGVLQDSITNYTHNDSLVTFIKAPLINDIVKIKYKHQDYE